MEPIYKHTLRSRLGFQTDREVADWFGISQQAVGQWPDDRPIPELRQLQAERKRPDLFGPQSAGEESQPEREVA